MEISPGIHHCHRCGIHFPRRFPLGRRPIYCGRTCRQRAYEARRRGAHANALPAPLHPGEAEPLPADPPPAYEAGRTFGLRHALRPDAPPDGRRHRLTLCGTYASTGITAKPFGEQSDILGRPCRTCVAVANRYPLRRAIHPAPDLARTKHHLNRLRAAYTNADHRELFRLVGQLLADVAHDIEWPPAPSAAAS